MRHGKKFNHLGRKTAHRKAMLSNMACSLIQHKRINTTVAKAKALRSFVEPLITKSKTDSTHSRRVVFSYLQNKEAVSDLYREIAPKVADRTGGYTRIIRTGYRLGDNAEMCMIELVDFNELYTNEKAKKTTRRSRRGGGAKSVEAGAATEATEVASDIEEAVVVEETAAETPKADDLRKIEGIGPKIATVLGDAGINTFAELAAKSADDIKKVLDEAEGNYARFNPTTWPQQAQLAADGKWDELKKLQDELDGGKPTE